MENKFSANLILFRKEKSLSQDKLAKLVGVTQQCVSEWEKGKTEPSMSFLWRMADVFDVTIDMLVGRDEF